MIFVFLNKCSFFRLKSILILLYSYESPLGSGKVALDEGLVCGGAPQKTEEYPDCD